MQIGPVRQAPSHTGPRIVIGLKPQGFPGLAPRGDVDLDQVIAEPALEKVQSRTMGVGQTVEDQTIGLRARRGHQHGIVLPLDPMGPVAAQTGGHGHHIRCVAQHHVAQGIMAQCAENEDRKVAHRVRRATQLVMKPTSTPPRSVATITSGCATRMP